ncbi:hypothetical protein QAD02_013371 [Eretmocerus hayati]|uniref:Uncharacterized protein n=1 Tax=Eretmocerus hayati TaxID=131215 RepID=A0ACC2P4X6_9HYME|nr:hypothetical protein QAD02_013371 [Eretmocerus hayati]
MTESDLQAKLCNINNKNGMLLEFLNEYDDDGKNKVSCGFTNWLEHSKAPIEGDHVSVYWPKSLEITEASSNFRNLLKSASFEKQLVKVLRTGGESNLSQPLQPYHMHHIMECF